MPKLFSIYTKIHSNLCDAAKAALTHLIYYYAHARARGKPDSFCNVKTARQIHA